MEERLDEFCAAVKFRNWANSRVTGRQNLTPCKEVLCSIEITPRRHILDIDRQAGEKFSHG